MRSGFIGSRPLHWFPFSSFPLFTHFLSFFCFMSFLASCPFISLLSFSCAHIGPGLSLYAHIHCTFGFQVAQVLIMRTACPCASGSLFIATTHTFVPSVLFPTSSSFCPCCAQMHICSSLSFCLPLGRRVCNPWSHRGPDGLLFSAGG